MNILEVSYLSDLDMDAYLFHDGTYFKSYDMLGAHEKVVKGVMGTSFVVWAPNAHKVRLIGSFNDWYGSDFEMKKYKDSGLWNIFIPRGLEGELYKYEIVTKKGDILHKADPYAFYSEVRPKTASIVWTGQDYEWNDENWMQHRRESKPYQEPINIYEMHLGSWKHKADGSFYAYKELAPLLVDYIKKMGYTHVEIMPLNEHPFDGSWGYQATGYYSVTSRYGSPDDFKYLVDYLHQHNVGIIMDWVPCHFCRDSHGLRLFDGYPVYESGYQHIANNDQWGTVNFDFSRKEVVSYLVSNAVFWFDKYHIDGLRVDAVAFMLYLDYGREHLNIKNEYGSNENIKAVEFIRKLNETIFGMFPGALMIAEESTAWPLVTAPVDKGGLGFNFKWNMGWMNDMLEYMELDPVFRKWHHNLITFSLTYAFSENYVLPLSHDEVVHGKRSLLDKMPGDYWQKFANLRILYGYMMAHPGKKLLFMGGEFGHFIEWNYKRELDWFLLDYDKHSGIMKFVEDLNKVYLKEKALYCLDDTFDGFEWIDLDNIDQSIVVFMRKGRDKEKVIVAVNFTPETYLEYKIGVDKRGFYKEILNSDKEVYGGSGVVNTSEIQTVAKSWHMRPYHINVKLPPLSVVYIKWLKDDQSVDERKQIEVKPSERNEKRNHRNDSSRGTGVKTSRNH